MCGLIIGWIANFFLIFGVWLIGRKWKSAHLFMASGNFLYLIESIRIERYDMIFLCSILGILSIKNWWYQE